jgi:hypothetical protein
LFNREKIPSFVEIIHTFALQSQGIFTAKFEAQNALGKNFYYYLLTLVKQNNDIVIATEKRSQKVIVGIFYLIAHRR